jgi:hypothetical protein
MLSLFSAKNISKSINKYVLYGKRSRSFKRRMVMDEKFNENSNLRKQINIRLEQELYNFLVKYSKDNYKTVTATVREMIATLYKEHKQSPIIVINKEKS